MSRSNHVFQVLVTKNNLAPIAAGNSVADLAPGQVGVFDFNTNLSIDGTAGNRNFYIAVGLDKDGDGVTDDVAKSRGTHIQSRNTAYYTLRPHTPGRPMKVVLGNYTAECETEYGIKVELRNQEIYRTQGFNQFTKTYSIVTSCCNGCNPTCPSGDANEITKLLKININNDPAGLIKAVAIARQEVLDTVPGISGALAVGDEVSDADLEAIMAYNATLEDREEMLYTDLEVETVTQKLNNFCDVNLQYFYPRETIAILSKASNAYGGFNCTGTIEVTQPAVFEEGSGYDIKQQEYMAKGYEGSRYRLSTLNGVADPVSYNADQNENYDQIAIAYDQVHKNAWLQYQNAEATYIAVPSNDSTTLDALIPILDGLLTPQGLDAKADDANAREDDETVIEQTQDKTPATDGIG